ncbi:MAG: phosphoglycerate kinase [Gammaproteobacteria bacterium]|jgi:phosphoglycerate kinase|nr:phosphoglycerate kinase [Gammaproteobacteria bacterium]
MTFRRMNQLDLTAKSVLIREDFNVPIAAGKVANDMRIRATLPTIEMARAAGAKVILMSHLGRPEEGVTIDQQVQFSLQPVADHLAQLLNCDVPLVSDYLTNPDCLSNTGSSVVLLENVRVNNGEKGNDANLAKSYAELCDIFVMDAFGTAHRAQASTHGVAEYAALACAGPLLAKELDALDRSLQDPARPLMAVVGGAKVSSKLEILKNLSTMADQLIVGGGIANTFLLASGINIGKSLHEPGLVDMARELMAKTNIPLPADVVVAKEFAENATATTKQLTEIDDNDMILDIGPATALRFAELIGNMKTIIWNGPVGVFEFSQFANGTETVAKAIAKNTGFSIAGGGETISAIGKYSVTEDISYISTGGGAFLEYVQGIKLPAVDILEKMAF